MAFEPTKHLRQLRGKGGASDYLDVKWRLVWLRDEHPDAAITTRVIEHDRQAGYALVQAAVVIPNGGSAEAHGDEDRKDFADYLCKAETKAIGRALAALGYGTQFVGDELDEGDRIADAPVERRPEPSRPAPRQEPRPLRPSAPPAAAAPAPGADYGWSDFWPWAKARGINDRQALDAAAGEVTSGKTPAEIRRLIEARAATA